LTAVYGVMKLASLEWRFLTVATTYMPKI